MGQESDWLMRQINDLASGLGYIISRGKGGSETEIIFPQKEEEKLPHKDKLQRLINNHQPELFILFVLNKIWRKITVVSEKSFFC